MHDMPTPSQWASSQPRSGTQMQGRPIYVGTGSQVLVSPGSTSLARPSSVHIEFFARMQTLHNLRVRDFEQTVPDKVKTVFGFEDEIIHRHLGGWHGLRGGVGSTLRHGNLWMGGGQAGSYIVLPAWTVGECLLHPIHRLGVVNALFASENNRNLLGH